MDCRDFESRQALEAEIRQRFSQTGAVLLINTGLEYLSKLDHFGETYFSISVP
jgi:hypothetical protein